MGAEKILIRHSSKAKDVVGLKKIEEKDREFLIEKIVYSIEKENLYTFEVEKTPEIMQEIEKNAEFAGEFISPCL